MKNIKVFGNIIAKLYQILNRKQQQGAIIVFLFILISAILETLGVSMVIPFIYAIMTPEILLEQSLVIKIVDLFNISSIHTLVLLIGAVLIFVFMLKNAVLIFSSYLQIKFGYTLQKDVSTKMLHSYLKRPYSYFIKTNSSEILRGIGADSANVKDALSLSFTLCTQFLTCIAIGLFMCVTDIILSVGVLGISGIGVYLITFIFKNKIRDMGILQRDASALTSKYAYEAINGAKEIIVTQRRDKFVEKYSKAWEKTWKSGIYYGVVSVCPSRLIEVLFMGVLVLMVCMRIQQGLNVDEFVPQLATFAVAGMRVLPMLSSITSCINGLIFQKPGIDAAYTNIKEVEEYEEKRKLCQNLHGDNKNEQKQTMTEFNKLEIKNITWRYENVKKDVLEKLSLNIFNGEAVALIGESGAGKTTLADIILGLFSPQKGNVEIDGVDIFSIPEKWSQVVGYVPQTVFLIDDTIRANIAFGINEEEIEEKRIWDVLEQAQLKTFVEQQPNGMDTIVGERGVKFSGGQRQRIAIARALYSNPSILVLDEATAALDSETEGAVMESIDALHGTKTLIIVAHRLTTIQKCDKIYEIKDGKAIIRKKTEV